MRSLIVCAALIVACGTPPVASSAAPFTSSEPSPTASASAAPSA